MTAAALLLTTSAASAPVRRREDAGDVVLPGAAAAGGNVVLEVRVAAPDLTYPVERSLGQRRAAEIRVHDHTGGVDDPA